MQRVDTTGQRELRLVGLSRSGNHAIINWLLAQMEGRTCFLNCVQPKQNPFATARATASGQPVVCNYRPFDLERELRGEFSQKDWLLYSYEDCFITMICSRCFEARHDEFVGPSRSRTDIVILRDPFNLFASRLRSSYSGVTPLTAVRIWKQHARQVLGQRRLFTQPYLAVLYNRWASDAAYRQRIVAKLGLRFTDANFRRVASTAGGSSFDGLQFDGSADRMSVLDRWQHYIDEPAYLNLFDEEMLQLSAEIFGELPAAGEVRRRLKPSRHRLRTTVPQMEEPRVNKRRLMTSPSPKIARQDLNSDVA